MLILLMTLNMAYADSGWVSRFLKNVASGVVQVNTSRKPQVTCPPDSAKPIGSTCAGDTDGFCEKLWNDTNKGNLDLPNGQKILAGKSNKSNLTNFERLDLLAFSNCEANLPEDLRASATEILKDLRDLLAGENSTPAWQSKLKTVMDRWNTAVGALAYRRVSNEIPGFTSIPYGSRTPAQKASLAAVQQKIFNEVLAAKYEKDENWLRAKKVFSLAKSDILAEIETLPLPADQKEKMSKRIRSIKISLPFSQLTGTEAERCSKTEPAANYSDDYNVLFVCAGFFNGYQDEDAMYLAIAHEISHSVDSDSSVDFFEGPVGKAMLQFPDAKGPAVSCEAWKGLRSGPLAGPKTVSEPPYPYQKLTDCLVPPKNIKAFQSKNILNWADKRSEQEAKHFEKSFQALADPKNPLYMRPDLAFAATQSRYPNKSDNISIAMPIFVQSLHCQKEKLSGQPITQDLQEKIYAAAVEETRDVSRAIQVGRYSSCGRECGFLQSQGLGRDASEYFADWLAIRTFPRHLANKKSPEEKKLAAASAFASFCDPGLKQNKNDTHGLLRGRRLSVYTPEVSSLVGCFRDDEVQKQAPNCGL